MDQKTSINKQTKLQLEATTRSFLFSLLFLFSNSSSTSHYYFIPLLYLPSLSLSLSFSFFYSRPRSPLSSSYTPLLLQQCPPPPSPNASLSLTLTGKPKLNHIRRQQHQSTSNSFHASFVQLTITARHSRLFFLPSSRTLIEADSDLWVAESLAPDLAKKQEEFIGKILWTELQYVSFLSVVIIASSGPNSAH